MGKDKKKKKKILKMKQDSAKTHKKRNGAWNALRATKLLMTNIITIIITVALMIIRKCPLFEPGAAAKRNSILDGTKKQLWLIKHIHTKSKNKNISIKKKKSFCGIFASTCNRKKQPWGPERLGFVYSGKWIHRCSGIKLVSYTCQRVCVNERELHRHFHRISPFPF